MDYANGVSFSRIFNPNTERVDASRAIVLGTGRPVVDWTYTYRPGGHLESIVDAVGTSSETFGLDDMYRLTSATAPQSYGSVSFAYDAIGNMTSKEGVTFQYPDPSHPHRAMATSGGLSLEYDASGNIETVMDGDGGGRVFTYDLDGRIASVTDNVTGRQVYYTYDPSGDRVKVREVDGGEETTTLFLGGLYEEKAGVGKKYVYLAGARVTEWRADGTKLFHTYNHLGSLSVVTDESGADVQRIEYKPYGEISRVHSTTFATSFGYAGALQDGISGLQDFGARSYEPSLGRFLSIDPIVSDPLDLNAMNPYGYGLGNPVSYVDVGGYSAWPSILGIAASIGSSFIPGCSVVCAAAIGAGVSGGVSVAENGGDLNQALGGAAKSATVAAAMAAIMQGARAAWAAHQATGAVSAQLSQVTKAQLRALFDEYMRAPAMLRVTAGALAAIHAGQEVQEVSPPTPQTSAVPVDYPGDWSPSEYMHREVGRANCTAKNFCDWTTVVGLKRSTELEQLLWGSFAMWPAFVLPFAYSGGEMLSIVGAAGVGSTLPHWVKNAGTVVNYAKNLEKAGQTVTREVADDLVRAARHHGVRVRLDPPHRGTPWNMPHLNVGNKGVHVPVPKDYVLPPW
jgi:RHS repeat-associated protein